VSLRDLACVPQSAITHQRRLLLRLWSRNSQPQPPSSGGQARSLVRSSPVFLHESRATSLALASTALTAYTGFQTTGRLGGDRLKMRHGARTMFRVGGLIAVGGFAVAVLSPWPVVAVAGFAIFGFGGSALIPMTFSAAGHTGGDGPGAAVFVSRFTTFTYSGVLLGPALIGSVAQLIGLSWTLAALLPVLLWVAAASLPSGRAPELVLDRHPPAPRLLGSASRDGACAVGDPVRP
jgi:MFS family permease